MANSMSGEQPPIIIAVVGVTGAGKSTFIKSLTQNPSIQIGAGFSSCMSLFLLWAVVDCSCSILTVLLGTHSCQSFTFRLPGFGQEIVLVDTPGLGDTSREGFDVLDELYQWLKLLRRCGVKMTGLIYLHCIMDKAFNENTHITRDVIQELVGVENMGKVVLVTNRWENVQVCCRELSFLLHTQCPFKIIIIDII